MPLTDATKKQIEDLVQQNEVVLFMKGSKQFPQCGFSSQVVQILNGLGASYTTFNVLSDPSIRDGIKEFSSWPTIPQLYVKGEFVGGCDIVKEMQADGSLQKLVAGSGATGSVGAGAAGAKPAPAGAPAKVGGAPKVTLTEAAASAIREATEPGSTDVLRFSIGPRFQYDLSFGPREAGDVEVTSNGVPLVMDVATAGKADGTSIDFIDGDEGGFKIVNPSAPVTVKQISVEELAKRLASGAKVHLYDVRTAGERALATIPGAVLLDEAARQELEGLDRGTPLVFHCHHGGRSQAAAEHFASKGFRDVTNVKGGIDAWSQTVDPKVARY